MTDEQIIDAALNAACEAVQAAIGQTDGGMAGLYFAEGNAEYRRFEAVMRAYLDYERALADDQQQALTLAYHRAQADLHHDCNEATIRRYQAARRALQQVTP